MKLKYLIEGLFELLRPTGNQYDRQVLASLNLSEVGSSAKFEFTHERAGYYCVGIIVPERIGSTTHRNLKSEILMECLTRGQQKSVRILGNNISPWWTDSTSGYGLLMYQVPGDFDVGRPVSFVLSVVATSGPERDTLGRVEVYVGQAFVK